MVCKSLASVSKIRPNLLYKEQFHLGDTELSLFDLY